MSDDEKVDLGENSKDKKKIYKTVGIIFGIIIVIFGIYINRFTKDSLYNGKISDNVFVEDVDISHLSKDEAIKKVNEKYIPENLNLEFEKSYYEIKSEDIDLKYNTEDLIKEAYDNTRTGSYLKDIKNYFTTSTSGKKYKINTSYDDSALDEKINSISEQINREVSDAKVSLGGSGVNITPSITGLEFVTEENKEVISKSLENKNYEVIQLKVNVTQPKISTKDVESIDTNLASFTTSFSAGQSARNYNIGLAASRCNNTILLPGETFSYNEQTGSRALSNGFLNASVIVNGNIQDGPGGGVCQTSTTLFNAALLSGLEITQVRNHSITSNYAPRGRDAMVNDGDSDLKFTNNFDHAVYVVCYRSGNTVSAAIYGAKEDRVGVNIRVNQFRYNGLPAAKTYRTITKNGKSEESFIYTSVYKK